MNISKKVFGLFTFLLLGLCSSTCLAEKLAFGALQKARIEGSVRVLVMLDDEISSRQKTKSNSQRKSEIAKKVSSVLNRLSEKNIRIYHRFNFIPAFAIEANAAMLKKLENDPAVIRIDIDAPGTGSAVAPDESSVLNNVSPLQSLGLDGAGMKVAVIDSGVDTDHVDLQSLLVGQQCFCSNSSGLGGAARMGKPYNRAPVLLKMVMVTVPMSLALLLGKAM